jgi:hypothetical protein
MPRKPKCSICGEPIEGEDWCITVKGKKACEECESNDRQYASTCYCFGPNGSDMERFTKNFGNEDSEFPTPVKEEIWKKTDGWRGHTEWKLNKGFVEVCSGWVTGMPDSSTQRKAELADYFEQIKDGKLTPPVEIWWLFGITSNVFSTVSEIVCREKDLEALKKWLTEIDGGVEHFEEMLS